jgi:subtilisin family serine protease
LRSLYYLKQQGIKIINLSGGGLEFSWSEYLFFKQNPDMLFFVAAGNDRLYLQGKREPSFYPANYNLPNVVAIGALTSMRKPATFSNYGPVVKQWARGVDVNSFQINSGETTMTGTSQAAPVFLRAYLKNPRLLAHPSEVYE